MKNVARSLVSVGSGVLSVVGLSMLLNYALAVIAGVAITAVIKYILVTQGQGEDVFDGSGAITSAAPGPGDVDDNPWLL